MPDSAVGLGESPRGLKAEVPSVNLTLEELLKPRSPGSKPALQDRVEVAKAALLENLRRKFTKTVSVKIALVKEAQEQKKPATDPTRQRRWWAPPITAHKGEKIVVDPLYGNFRILGTRVITCSQGELVRVLEGFIARTEEGAFDSLLLYIYECLAANGRRRWAQPTEPKIAELPRSPSTPRRKSH